MNGRFTDSMKKIQDAHILIVHGTPYNRKMIGGILQLMGAKHIDNAFEASDALTACLDEPFDVVLAEMGTGINDAIALTRQLRQNPASKNNLTPVIAITNGGGDDVIDDAREAGITDMIKAPYSADNIFEHVMYAINTPAEEQINDAAHAPAPQNEPETKSEEWPNEEESNALTGMLMDHYLRHHEIVLTKLRFAQNATKESIGEIKQIHEKIKTEKDSKEDALQDFSSMWEKIIKMFVKGGLSEQALFDIEKIITQIPDDIKQHYNDLTSQDQAFLARMEKLNKSSYESAKKKVLTLQDEPNPITGKTPADYQAAITQENDEDEESGTVKAIVYDPVQQKMIFKSFESE